MSLTGAHVGLMVDASLFDMGRRDGLRGRVKGEDKLVGSSLFFHFNFDPLRDVMGIAKGVFLLSMAFLDMRQR